MVGGVKYKRFLTQPKKESYLRGGASYYILTKDYNFFSLCNHFLRSFTITAAACIEKIKRVKFDFMLTLKLRTDL